MPVSDSSSVRGIGVAVSASASMPARTCLMRSLCITPKRCSSSTMSRPRFLNFTSSESSRCVPITTSTVPSARPQHRRLLLRREEARQHLHPHRIVGEPLAERLAVLAREQRRRHEHRDLLAVLHGLERGPDRDLGLAVPDVAAHEAVHRYRPFHVGLRLLDRAQLIGRLLERERVLDLVLPRRVGRELVARRREPAAVEHDQLARDVAHRVAHARLRLLPVAAAHLRQLRRVATGVLADDVDLIGRDVDLLVAAELDEQVVALELEHRARDHAREPTDAVLTVHDVVARREAFVVVGRALRAARRAVHRRRPVRSASATSASRTRHDRAAVERRDDDAGTRRVEQRRALGYRRDDVDDDAFVGEHLGQPVGRSATLGGEQHAVALGAQRGEALRQRLGVSDHRVERARREVRRRGVLGRGEHRHHAARVCASSRSNGNDSRGNPSSPRRPR